MAKRKRKKQKNGFDSELVDLARVTKVTAGGRQLSFRAVMIVGNKKGKVGVGVSKGKDVAQAIEKASRKAKKHLIEVSTDKHTIAHSVQAKFNSSEVLLRPQSKGRGLVAGGVVRTICEKAGIEDISSKILTRSRNKLNIARATMEALQKLKA